jgi:hypothetical protein
MGIKKLNRDVGYNDNLWINKSETENVVIDGKSLMYYIWGLQKMNLVYKWTNTK